MTPLEYAKLGGIAFLALLLSGGGLYFGSLRGDAKAAEAKTALEADHAAQLRSLADAWQARELVYEGQTQRYTNEIEILRHTRAEPLPGTPLRVCFTAPQPILPASATGGDQPAGAGTLPRGDAKVPGSGGDIRPGLFFIADEADNLLAECRRTQPLAAK